MSCEHTGEGVEQLRLARLLVQSDSDAEEDTNKRRLAVGSVLFEGWLAAGWFAPQFASSLQRSFSSALTQPCALPCPCC